MKKAYNQPLVEMQPLMSEQSVLLLDSNTVPETSAPERRGVISFSPKG